MVNKKVVKPFSVKVPRWPVDDDGELKKYLICPIHELDDFFDHIEGKYIYDAMGDAHAVDIDGARTSVLALKFIEEVQ